MFRYKCSNRYIKIVFFILICAFAYAVQQNNVEQPHLAGSWYPAQTIELNNLLQSMEASAQNTFAMQADGTKIRALIVPHAGYRYSGAIASAAYQLLKNSAVDRVFILAPSHFVAFDGIALPSFTRYRMPNGIISVDTSIVDKLKLNSLFQENPSAFNPEHAVEIQLPFVHYFLPKAEIVPLIVGSLSQENIEVVAASLMPYITPTTLVIISSDFTHYGATFNYTPFADNIVLNVRQLDSNILDAIQHNNRVLYAQLLQETGATVCGRMPIDILLKMIEQDAFGPTITRLVAYGTSQDASNGSDQLVSYASLVVTNEIDNDAFNMQEKNSLLRYARDILTQSFAPTLDPELLKPVMTPLLQQSKGVFVTLYKKDGAKKSLRGCIGRTSTTKPLYQLVAEMTLASAFQDSRFTPVTHDELGSIEIEISVLTPPRPIDSYKDIVLNKHGIILTVGNSSALFLPRVPQEFGLTFEQTLTELSKKAGLAEDAWLSPDAKFQVFESLDFGEE